MTPAKSRSDSTVVAEVFGADHPKSGGYIVAMTDIRVAEIAALVGDPARANILFALMDGRALTASELALTAGVTPQTTSGHLAKLTQARLLDLVKQGRHRYYRIRTPLVGQMLEGILSVAAEAPPRHRPRSKQDDAMRRARTCYDHFAGKLGVGLTDCLCSGGHVVLSEEGGEVTETGIAFLQRFGIDHAILRQRRRAFCRPCLDWTERRAHLGGAIGAALAARCFELRWVERRRDTRAVSITPAGLRGLRQTFGLVV
jgi:DNA-binding transcriptional ArsR family regulator